MVKSLINAAHWNTANANIYHQPWTTDKQNRFFSLEAWGPISDKPSFTAKFLGRPVNVAFKAKHKVMGKEEPCLCILFAPSATHPNGVARLVQATNFMIIDAFPGYDPIDHELVKKYKTRKDLAAGTWYKKIWNTYCSAEESGEYKQPEPPGPVCATPPSSKKDNKKDPSQSSLDNLFNKKAEKSAFSGDEKSDEEDDGNETEEIEVGGDVSDDTTNTAKSTEKSSYLKTYEDCLKYYMDRRYKSEQFKKNDAKEKCRNEFNKNQKKREDPNWDSDDDDDFGVCSDASEYIMDSEVEDEVIKQASETWKAFGPKKPPSKPTPPKQSGGKAGTVSSTPGNF